jgi:hypothetical protein
MLVLSSQHTHRHHGQTRLYSLHLVMRNFNLDKQLLTTNAELASDVRALHQRVHKDKEVGVAQQPGQSTNPDINRVKH